MKKNNKCHCEHSEAISANLIKLFSLGLFILLTACGTSQPTTFYRLSAAPTDIKPIISRNISVGIDTVSVAGYLERPQIVTLGNNAELNMSEYNRWAEPLSHSIQRVLAENISKQMKNGMAKPADGSLGTYDYVVLVELNQFDGKFNDKAKLDAWWTINSKSLKKPIREHTTLEINAGGDYNSLIAGHNELLNQLSQQISAKINKLK